MAYYLLLGKGIFGMDEQEQKVQSYEAQAEITRKGNPRKPQGEEGRQMLRRMNESHSAVTEWALSFLHFNESDWVLEIGCGGGATLTRIAKQIQTGHLIGVDYSEISVELSQKQNADDIRNGKIEILEASVEKLPFENKIFDKIVTVESFYFWPDPIENLKEVYRVLKTGGEFLLVADIYQKDGLRKEALEAIKQYQLLNPTPDQFKTMFERAGFSNIQLKTKQGTDWICVKGSG